MRLHSFAVVDDGVGVSVLEQPAHEQQTKDWQYWMLSMFRTKDSQYWMLSMFRTKDWQYWMLNMFRTA